MSLLFEPFYCACMGLKVIFENVAILYTPYLHNPKHSFKKDLIKNIVLLKELNPSLEKDFALL
jgi:hypothetical protein